jgi:hypothetical protein
MRTYVRVRAYRYIVVEHDAERPWIIVGEIQHLTIDLADSQSFYEWAARKWPGPRFDVQLDPWQLTTDPHGPGGLAAPDR